LECSGKEGSWSVVAKEGSWSVVAKEGSWSVVAKEGSWSEVLNRNPGIRVSGNTLSFHRI